MIWLKLLLLPFYFIYSLFIYIRNSLFDYGFFSSTKFKIPVISVGNLCVGGSGKTPHVEYLVDLLIKSKSVSVLSRGYGRITNGFFKVNSDSDYLDVGDEPLQIALKFPTASVAVSEKRSFGIKELLKEKIDVVILDDAFQHRWVKPGLNILLTKYNDLFINDNLIPLGRLREHKSCYLRADLIVVTDTPNPFLPLDEYRLVEQISPMFYQKVCFSYFKYLQPKSLFTDDKKTLENSSIILVTGIANSHSLIEYIESKKGKIKHHHNFRDHYNYKVKDIKKIIKSFSSISNSDRLILTTEKDAVRLKKYKEYFDGIPIYFIPIQVKFHGKTNFNSLINEYVEENNLRN